MGGSEKAFARRNLNRRIVWKAVAIMVLAGSAPVAAADVEYRDFNVLIDGKPAGQYVLTINVQNPDRVVVTGQAKVSVNKFLVYTYSYSFHGTEVWEANRLVSLESTANDNGKVFAVKAAIEDNHLQVRTNGKGRISPRDVWTTTFWHLPEPAMRNRDLNLLDSDTGRPIVAHLEYVDVTQTQMAGRLQNISHYRISGGMQADLWYDGHDRLVRQETLEDGHRSTLDLTSIRR